ncbi:MAG: aldo/keto reductase, partial [Bdellovibrio sp.]
LIDNGLAHYWGTSEWTGAQLQSAHILCRDRGWTPPTVEQPQYSLLVRERFESVVAPLARDLGMGLVIWSPLASGFLSGKYDDGIRDGRLSQMDWVRDLFFTEKNRERVKQMKVLADQMGCTRSQLALAWAAEHRAVSSVILGVTQTRQLLENLGALDVEISNDLKFELNRLFSPTGSN